MTYAAPPIALPTPPVLSNASMWSPFGAYRITNTLAAPTAQTPPAANQAIYIPFVVTTTATFQRGFWYNGTAVGGNVSVAIYTPDATRQATTGAVVQAGTSVIQTAAFTASYTATPGIYYMAISYSAATAAGCFGQAASTRPDMAGLYTQATGVHPLPASAVFAAWSSLVIPVYGVATTSFAI